MPFTPKYFGDSDTFPSNGAAYVKSGEAAPTALAGLEGRGPHGGYDTATYKCGVCHAAHSGGTGGAASGPAAAATAQFLLRAGTTGCEYCHVGSGLFSSVQVYTADNGDVTIPTKTNSGHPITGEPVTVPDSSIGTMTLQCTSCHSVHGTTNDWMPTDFYKDGSHAAMDTAQYGYKLLLASPGVSAVPDKEVTPVTDPGANPAAVNQFALSAWCASCHDKAAQAQKMTSAEPTMSDEATFTASVDGGVTHQKTTLAKNASGDISGPHDSTMVGVGNGAPQCYTCHRGGGLSAEVPVPTDEATVNKLKEMGYTLAPDESCSLCHYGTLDFASDPANVNGTSDWPHSSTNDVDMLGDWSVDFTDSSQLTSDTVSGGVTKDNTQEVVCGRCHRVASKTDTTITYYKSWHYLFTHQYPINPLTGSWETSGTIGTLEGAYSEGYSSAP